MKIEQTNYFKEDLKHYIRIAKENMYTSRKDEIKKAIFKLDHLRGSQYTDKLAAKANQCLKSRFYVREA